jgi:opacity protein-like surface antigen
MRRKASFVFVLSATLITLTAVDARAQDDRRVWVTFGGGWTAPNSEVRDRLGDGYNFTFGVDVPVSPVVSIEGQYGFNGLGQKNITIPLSPQPHDTGTPTQFFTDMNMQYGSASVIVADPDGGVRPYGLLGMGVYYRPIKVTTPGVGFAPGYCDPWLYYCYPGGWVPVENIVGERSSTDFGMSLGGGLKFGRVFAELRYHYIWGPTIEGPPAGEVIVNPLVNGETPTTSLVGHKANGQFFATTFGVRF